jgi:carboxymethylenebutenolidase
MCEQDQFEKDRQEYEARGLVTRRQFGVLLGAGIAMMLPKAADAVAVTESEVTVMTPDGTADCYFVHLASGRLPASSCGRTSSGCGRRSVRWANGSPNRAIPCSS